MPFPTKSYVFTTQVHQCAPRNEFLTIFKFFGSSIFQILWLCPAGRRFGGRWRLSGGEYQGAELVHRPAQRTLHRFHRYDNAPTRIRVYT